MAERTRTPYSLYVWHTPIQERTLPIMLITLPLSIAAALLSHRVVEAPFLRLRHRWWTSSAPMDRDSEPSAARPRLA